jgi:hypothetical protein
MKGYNICGNVMIMLLLLLLIMMMTAMIMTTNSATACQAQQNFPNSHLMPQTYRFSSAQRLHFCSACSRPF